jgi:protein-tyrosine-phosphatase
MAEGFFRKYSPEGYEPLSAGTRPSDISPFAIEAMREDGIDISKKVKNVNCVRPHNAEYPYNNQLI